MATKPVFVQVEPNGQVSVLDFDPTGSGGGTEVETKFGTYWSDAVTISSGSTFKFPFFLVSGDDLLSFPGGAGYEDYPSIEEKGTYVLRATIYSTDTDGDTGK